MTKDTAAKQLLEFLDTRNAYKEDGTLKSYQEDAIDVLDFLVDELKMLPPLRELEHFPGQTDNGWEDS